VLHGIHASVRVEQHAGFLWVVGIATVSRKLTY
jgi:hypothetical protein